MRCGKTLYDTAGAAREAMRAAKNNGRSHRVQAKAVAYFCDTCDAYHWGHDYSAKRKKMGAARARLK